MVAPAEAVHGIRPGHRYEATGEYRRAEGRVLASAPHTGCYSLPWDGGNPALIRPCRGSHHASSENHQEDSMLSLLVAAALGLGLLSAGTQGAAAAPFHEQAPAGFTPLATQVHYQRGYDHRGYYQPHYAPPPRHHWHRYAPPPPRPHHSWHQPRPHHYGWR
jgi:hypothetical protein